MVPWSRLHASNARGRGLKTSSGNHMLWGAAKKKKKFILQDRKHHPDTVVVSSTSSEPHHKDAKSLGTTPSFSVSNFFLRVTGRVVSPFTHLGSFSFYTPFLHHLTILNSTLLLPNLTACKGDKILSFNYSPSSITSTWPAGEEEKSSPNAT